MARMLKKYHSTPMHIKTVLRHIRLCNCIYGNNNKYSIAINPHYEALMEKFNRLEQAKLDRYFAHDNVVMTDHSLDNQVRTTYEQCKQYIRDNNDAFILDSFFPNGRFGDMIRRNISRELNDVEQLILKVENLGESHPLFECAGNLKGEIENVHKATDEYNEAIRTEQLAAAECDLAKEALQKQYARNYFEALQEKGRHKADLMFPVSSPKKDEEEVKEDIVPVTEQVTE